MEINEYKPDSADLFEMVRGLQQAKEGIPQSQAKLKGKPKPKEEYLICKNGIVAETNQNPTKEGWTVVKGA